MTGTEFSLDGSALGYGDCRVLHDLRLDIRAGEKVALVGSSGAGKSTLLAALHDQQRDRTALCPQQLGLVDVLSAYHNVYMGRLQEHGALYNAWNMVRPALRHRRAIAAQLEELGIADKLWDSVDRLSGGQRQRVAVARALYSRRPIFLGDEPVSSLDFAQGQYVLKLVLERHATCVVALHNASQAVSLFDRVIGLRGGRITMDQPSGDVDVAALDRLYAH